MSGDQIAQAAYYGIIVVALGGAVLAGYSGRAGTALKHMAVWGGLFGALILGYQNKHLLEGTLLPATQEQRGDGSVVLMRTADGHFAARAQINGVTVPFVVDTGASLIVLTQADARRVGIDPNTLRYTGEARTANGVVGMAPVMLESFTLEGIEDRNVSAVVNEGQMDESLLGLAYLDRFARIVIEGDRLVLER
ncbi:TIGR02281 family clan AA aspartic protease [Roseobacter sp. HKCCA0434]|uniref:retropepsin-like aspartic protease family protein n=1 Tax=Roseobacter sp. HKCCA0434 TaxID=3079297 RepID=UPI002905E28F|nr:TIGR02281 family clan AA aspartic protease [Roseobacter sp. HKCCA0434]